MHPAQTLHYSRIAWAFGHRLVHPVFPRTFWNEIETKQYFISFSTPGFLYQVHSGEFTHQDLSVSGEGDDTLIQTAALFFVQWTNAAKSGENHNDYQNCNNKLITTTTTTYDFGNRFKTTKYARIQKHRTT